MIAGCGHRAADELRWQSPVDIATGGGTKGPWQQNESNFDYVDDPSIALDRDSNAHVVWVDQRDKDIHFQIYAPNGKPLRARALNISKSPKIFSWLPRIALDGQNTYVLWQEIVFSGGSHGGEIFFARSTDGGKTFAMPINLSQSVPGDGKGRIDARTWQNGSLDLAVAPNGAIYAAWTEYDGPLWFATSRDRGESFGAPEQVAGASDRPARAPALAVGTDGDVYLAWTHGEDRGADIHVARRHANRFMPARLVAETPTYSDAPKLVVDRAGIVHVAFTETDGGPFDRPSVKYARSRDRAATFDAPRTLAADAAYPSLAIDGPEIVVVWERVRDGQARGLGFTRSRDAGDHFASAQDVPHSVDPAGGTNGSHQGQLMRKLALGARNVAVVNSSLAIGRGSRVWLMRALR